MLKGNVYLPDRTIRFIMSLNMCYVIFHNPWVITVFKDIPIGIYRIDKTVEIRLLVVFHTAA